MLLAASLVRTKPLQMVHLSGRGIPFKSYPRYEAGSVNWTGIRNSIRLLRLCTFDERAMAALCDRDRELI